MIRQAAMSLDGTVDRSELDRLAFSHSGEPAYAWSFLEPTKVAGPGASSLGVLAVRCPIGRKQILLDSAPDIYRDDDQYRGHAVILVRLDAVPETELVALLKEAWRL